MTFELILAGLCALVLSPCPQQGVPTTLTALLPAGAGNETHSPQLWAEWSDWSSGKMWDEKLDTPLGVYLMWKLEGRIQVSVDGKPLDLAAKSPQIPKSVMPLGEALKNKPNLKKIATHALHPAGTTLVKALLDIEIRQGGRGSLKEHEVGKCNWTFLGGKKQVATSVRVSLDNAKKVTFTIDRNLDGSVDDTILLNDDARPDGEVRVWLLNASPPSNTLPPIMLHHFYHYYALSSDAANVTKPEKEHKIECEQIMGREDLRSHDLDASASKSAEERKKEWSRRVMQAKPVACAVCQGCGP